MSWKDILKEEIKHYKELPKDMPDAVHEEIYVEEGKEKQALAFIKEMLNNPSEFETKDINNKKISDKTHKIISFNDPYDQMFYRIVER
tara:strand:- start:307 stop:570 length:264 start_codon:yes stop_codon:yes gene_type:complete